MRPCRASRVAAQRMKHNITATAFSSVVLCMHLHCAIVHKQQSIHMHTEHKQERKQGPSFNLFTYPFVHALLQHTRLRDLTAPLQAVGILSLAIQGQQVCNRHHRAMAIRHNMPASNGSRPWTAPYWHDIHSSNIKLTYRETRLLYNPWRCGPSDDAALDPAAATLLPAWPRWARLTPTAAHLQITMGQLDPRAPRALCISSRHCCLGPGSCDASKGLAAPCAAAACPQTTTLNPRLFASLLL